MWTRGFGCVLTQVIITECGRAKDGLAPGVNSAGTSHPPSCDHRVLRQARLLGCSVFLALRRVAEALSNDTQAGAIE